MGMGAQCIEHFATICKFVYRYILNPRKILRLLINCEETILGPLQVCLTQETQEKPTAQAGYWGFKLNQGQSQC
jgi:hypothetical protein